MSDDVRRGYHKAPTQVDAVSRPRLLGGPENIDRVEFESVEFVRGRCAGGPKKLKFRTQANNKATKKRPGLLEVRVAFPVTKLRYAPERRHWKGRDDALKRIISPDLPESDSPSGGLAHHNIAVTAIYFQVTII